MVKLIRDKIMEHMEGNNLFSKHQPGYRKGYSCATQLIIPPVYEVYRGFIGFAFSVCVCVCMCLFVCKLFLSKVSQELLCLGF